MAVRPLLALGGVGAVLVAVLAMELTAVATPDAPPPVAPAHRPVATVPAPVADHVQAHVATILARPLFVTSRRPPPVGAAPAQGGPTALPRLTGVLVGEHGKRLIFAAGPAGKPVVVGEGGHIGPYVVQSIGAGEATLQGPEGEKILRPTYGQADNRPDAVVAGPAGAASIIELMRTAGLPGQPTLPTPPASFPGPPGSKP